LCAQGDALLEEFKRATEKVNPLEVSATHGTLMKLKVNHSLKVKKEVIAWAQRMERETKECKSFDFFSLALRLLTL